MRNYVGSGDSISVPFSALIYYFGDVGPDNKLPSGSLVLWGGFDNPRVGVLSNTYDLDSLEPNAVILLRGVFNLLCNSEDSFELGGLAYSSSSSGAVTPVDPGGISVSVGVVVKEKNDDSETVQVAINL